MESKMNRKEKGLGGLASRKIKQDANAQSMTIAQAVMDKR
jgi:hypothetical protein